MKTSDETEYEKYLDYLREITEDEIEIIDKMPEQVINQAIKSTH